MRTATDHLRGLAATRYIKALGATRGDKVVAQHFAAGRGWTNTPEVYNALVEAVDSSDGAALIAVGEDYAAALRPSTIIGRILGFRRVPFNTRLIAATGASEAHWSGEGGPKPLSAPGFADATLGSAKVSATCVVTQELLNSAAQWAEAALSQDLIRAGSQAEDVSFIDPASGAIAGVRPASVTNGATPIPSTGSSVAQIDADLQAAVDALVAAGSNLAAAHWIMNTRTATALAAKRGSGGALAYPGVGVRGGALMGLPVIASGNVPIDAGTSGEPTIIALLDPSEIRLADDGRAELGVARHATVQMSDAPSSGAQPQASLWQLGLVALRAEHYVNWLPTRPGMAQYISGVTY